VHVTERLHDGFILWTQISKRLFFRPTNDPENGTKRLSLKILCRTYFMLHTKNYIINIT